jgi:hypothetical protein
MNVMSGLSRSPKISPAVFAGMILAVLLACSSFGKTPAPTLEPVSFGYCGARMTELCVVSFGRDDLGNAVVNLFVPRMRYPAFHLNVVRRSGADLYECTWSKIVETSVYCVGKPLNLGEGIEIQLLAKLDERLLAKGTFTVNAFLVATPLVEAGTGTEEPRIGSGTGENETSTPEVFQETETVAPTNEPSSAEGTSAPSDSYPNYP